MSVASSNLQTRTRIVVFPETTAKGVRSSLFNSYSNEILHVSYDYSSEMVIINAYPGLHPPRPKPGRRRPSLQSRIQHADRGQHENNQSSTGKRRPHFAWNPQD